MLTKFKLNEKKLAEQKKKIAENTVVPSSDHKHSSHPKVRSCNTNTHAHTHTHTLNITHTHTLYIVGVWVYGCVLHLICKSSHPKVLVNNISNYTKK